MVPWNIVGRTTSPDGRELVLYERAGEAQIRVDGWELMSSRAHRSEEALAELACEGLGERAGARVLVGGLGMGFTAAAALSCLGDAATVVVAELVPEVVEWNRGPIAAFAGRPLDDPRTRVFTGDVADAIDEGGWDAVALDIDNGPHGLVDERNDRIYSLEGARRVRRGLRPGGALVTWSSDDDDAYVERLREAGFSVTRRAVPARGRPDDPEHVLWVARAPQTEPAEPDGRAGG